MTVPVVPLKAAEKVSASALVVVTAAGLTTPVESVFQNAETLVSHVPVATPEPAVVPFVSQ